MNELMDVTQIADYLNVTTQTVKRWVRTGKFPNPDIAIEKTKRWKQKTIEDFLYRKLYKD